MSGDGSHEGEAWQSSKVHGLRQVFEERMANMSAADQKEYKEAMDARLAELMEDEDGWSGGSGTASWLGSRIDCAR